MIFDQEILDALEQVETRRWEGESWRVVMGERNPLLANRTGARWNPRDTAALYTSVERETVLAELDHLRTIQTPVVRRGLYRLHWIRFSVERMLDLRDPVLLQGLGVGNQELASDDHTPSRRVGGAAAWLGCDAILVPSARGPGANLIIFPDNQDPDGLLEAVGAEDLED